jgi:BirA family transcriptional regulator, biotin operon repressor / biotin---[acetyl-CoA-carboxylase] ligase
LKFKTVSIVPDCSLRRFRIQKGTDVNGIFLWGTGQKDMADKIDLSRLSDMPSTWSAELQALSPWREISLLFEGPGSMCRVSEKFSTSPVIHIAGACSSVLIVAGHLCAIECLPEWGSVICTHQWHGMGQLGRAWESPPGNLYAALRLPNAPEKWNRLLSLLAGDAIVRALQEIGVAATLKWPNDILIGRKKAGGVLIRERPGTVLAGVGLNLISAPSPEQLRPGHVMAATRLSESGRCFMPLALWQRILDRGRFFIEDALRSGTRPFIERISAHMAFLNETIMVDTHMDTPYSASCLGLSENGGLEVHIGNETKTIHSGSIYPLNYV